MLLTHDMRTVPRYAYDRVAVGESMAGVIVVPHAFPIGRAIEEILLVVAGSAKDELQDRVFYLPWR